MMYHDLGLMTLRQPFKSVLVTGGTGSFGRELIKNLLEGDDAIERIIVFSRDELKQWEMREHFPKEKYPQLRFFLGDIRDQARLELALERIETVIHAAALKQVPAAEYNPIEFINTNVLGANNVVRACLNTGVKTVVALSTDKAAAPINLYGATKLCSDKLFVAANNIVGERALKLSIVRYGNVMGSRGSVIPYFLKKAGSGILPITDPSMTRFNITLKEGVEMVKWVAKNCVGGEIYVPKIPSYCIKDLAEAIGPNCEQKIVGIRPGEKLHEEMITTSDSFTTVDLGNYYAILPSDSYVLDTYKNNKIVYTDVPKGFAYNSGTNPSFLSISQIRRLIKENVDQNFAPV